MIFFFVFLVKDLRFYCVVGFRVGIRSFYGLVVCLWFGFRIGLVVLGGVSSIFKLGGGCWIGILVFW